MTLTNEQESQRQEIKLVFIALLSIALISTLLTGYMINNYVATYSLVMKTEIDIDVTYFDYSSGEPILNLSVRIVNPNQKELPLRKIGFDVYLNQKYMDHHVITHIPAVDPKSQVTFDHTINLSLDRMFTVEDAQEQGKWEWKVSGSGYVETMFGDTLLRFTTITKQPPASN